MASPMESLFLVHYNELSAFQMHLSKEKQLKINHFWTAYTAEMIESVCTELGQKKDDFAGKM